MKYWYFTYEVSALFPGLNGGHEVICSTNDFFPITAATEKVRKNQNMPPNRYVGITNQVQISEADYKTLEVE